MLYKKESSVGCGQIERVDKEGEDGNDGGSIRKREQIMQNTRIKESWGGNGGGNVTLTAKENEEEKQEEKAKKKSKRRKQRRKKRMENTNQNKKKGMSNSKVSKFSNASTLFKES